MAGGQRRRSHAGAGRPHPATCNIDPGQIEAAVTERTKALLPVHLYGQPADLDPLLACARTHGLALVEDAAQAHGARYKGRRIGAHGDVVCWSFYPGKNLGALGDGGAITTDRPDLADRIRVLRNYGSRQKYVNDVQGVNSRLGSRSNRLVTNRIPPPCQAVQGVKVPGAWPSFEAKRSTRKLVVPWITADPNTV